MIYEIEKLIHIGLLIAAAIMEKRQPTGKELSTLEVAVCIPCSYIALKQNGLT
jgi:hypothetical protein